MNTEYVALPENATVADAMSALRANEEALETLNTLFLIDSGEHLKGSVPLAKLFIASGATALRDLASENLIRVDVDETRAVSPRSSTNTIC
jgi:magnesium transporter